MKCILGIDVGTNGGISYFIKDIGLKTEKMPKDLSNLSQILKNLHLVYDLKVYIEKVSLRPDDLYNMGKAFRIQKMLMNYQKILDILEFNLIKYEEVYPMTWQSYLKARVKGQSKQDRKNHFKELAQAYYPFTKVTLWNADAILIMHYGRSKEAEKSLK